MSSLSVAGKMWLIIPAAGVGSRMQADRPKQYLLLNGRPIIEHTLERLAKALPQAEFVICLNPQDPYWLTIQKPAEVSVREVSGGKERADSVFNGLKAISGEASEDDWVLVHDVARPCVRESDITNLVTQLQGSAVGGILALPVADTMKRATQDNRISETVDRTALWHALTPQMFRFGKLYRALDEGLAAGVRITDEASALEWAGFSPQLVAGHRDNIKVTHPDDIAFAELFILAQEEQGKSGQSEPSA